MATPRYTQAGTEAAALRAAGIPAFTDPEQAAANLPCVLFTPPELTFDRFGGGASVTWRLAVLADPPADAEAWRALDELLELLAGVATITTAVPGQYTLAGERDPFPAYICTATD